MLTLPQIRKKLEDRRINAVSEGSGLHYNTIWQVIKRPDRNPSYTTIKALSDYFETQDQQQA